jgi:UPF0716 protein FxsA
MTTSVPPPQAPQQRRSRVRTILPLAVAAWAVLEIWLLTVVARAAGGLTVVLLLIAGLMLGALAVKRAGRSAWQSLASSLQPGAAPEAAAGRTGSKRGAKGAGAAMLGGLLLMVPGFASDAVGLLLLFPPTRALLRGITARSLDRRRASYEPGSLGDLFQQARTADEQLRIHRPDGKVIQGEVVDKGAAGDVPGRVPADAPKEAGDDENPGPRR